jgi:hypothetical protein
MKNAVNHLAIGVCSMVGFGYLTSGTVFEFNVENATSLSAKKGSPFNAVWYSEELPFKSRANLFHHQLIPDTTTSNYVFPLLRYLHDILMV